MITRATSLDNSRDGSRGKAARQVSRERRAARTWKLAQR